jgi:hypothetical protein
MIWHSNEGKIIYFPIKIKYFKELKKLHVSGKKNGKFFISFQSFTNFKVSVLSPSDNLIK